MSKENITSRATCMVVAWMCAMTTVMAHAADEFPRDVLKGIEAMRRMPADGFHVVESQGRLLLVSTNGHYVVSGGRILDLWNQLEVKRVADLEGTLRLPLARMGINAASFGGLVIDPANATARVTVFLDPASADSRKLLPQLRQLGNAYRLELIFVPAQPARAAVSRAIICDTAAAQRFFLEGTVPAPLPAASDCGQKELERARVSLQLLGIQTLPFSVAGNGVTLAGAPDHYRDFVAANQETAR
jgi:thiol:disulfide interchange protein DsbC